MTVALRNQRVRVPGLKTGFLIGAALTGLASVAHAQTAPSPDGLLAEIVVTAQKRSENIQSVPIAVTAFGGQALRERGVARIEQLANAVPNVQLQDFRGLGQPTFVIRGVALLDFNANNTPAAGVYVDDVYQSSVVMGSGAIYDVERVEVLKGPQAGLYGRNTTGGAVQVISKKPTIGDTSGYFDASYGSYETAHLEAGQSIPLGDTFAARVAFSLDKGWDGWQTSLPSGKTWGRPDRQAVRGQLLWRPNDRLSANLKLFYARDDSEMTLGTAVARYNAFGGTCAAVAAGHMNPAGCLTWNQLIRPSSGSAALQSDDGKTTLSQPVNQLHNRDVGGALNITYDLGSATFSSITGYDHFIFGLKDDFAGAVDQMLVQTQRAPINYISQEFRLASNAGDSPLSWIVGTNYALDRYTDLRKDFIADNRIILGLPSFSLTPATGRLDLGFRQRTEYYGVFGQADYAFTDKLTVSAALRYSNEEKQYRDGYTSFPLANRFIFSNLNANYELKDHFTGKVSARYQATSDAMVYGTISKGYKSGGFFGGFPSSISNIVPYKEEVIYAYEAGAKTQWLDRRLSLNGAVFFYDHRDAQGYSTVPNPLLPGQYIYNLTNVGTEHHYGVEVDATAHPVRGLTLHASLARLKAKVTESDGAFTGLDGTSVPYDGRPVDYAPKWSGEILARYEHALSGGYRGGVQADYNFRTDRNFAPTLVNKALYALDGFGLLGGRVFVTTPTGWTASLFGTNLAGEKYKIAATADGLGSYQQIYGQPRKFGVGLTKSW